MESVDEIWTESMPPLSKYWNKSSSLEVTFFRSLYPIFNVDEDNNDK